MNLAHGGHLSHGSPANFSGRLYKVVAYGVDRETETIDFNEVEDQAKKHKPKIIVVGASAYPRTIDFGKFRQIADSVGAVVMSDIAHIAGLVAAGIHPSPVPMCEFVTTTTHKTLRGPRGGIVMCKADYAKTLDSRVFPGSQGGPLMHVIAAKAVALKEALSDEFKAYQAQIVKNAKALAAELTNAGHRLVSGGTDNHLMLIDLTDKGITGKEAGLALDQAGITVNQNMIPFDKRSPMVTSGVRLAHLRHNDEGYERRGDEAHCAHDCARPQGYRKRGPDPGNPQRGAGPVQPLPPLPGEDSKGITSWRTRRTVS